MDSKYDLLFINKITCKLCVINDLLIICDGNGITPPSC